MQDFSRKIISDSSTLLLLKFLEIYLAYPNDYR